MGFRGTVVAVVVAVIVLLASSASAIPGRKSKKDKPTLLTALRIHYSDIVEGLSTQPQEVVDGFHLLLSSLLPETIISTPKPHTRPNPRADPMAEMKFFTSPGGPQPPSKAETLVTAGKRHLQVATEDEAVCSGVGLSVNASGVEFDCSGTEVSESVFDAILGVQDLQSRDAINILEDVLPSDFDFGSLLPEDTGITVNLTQVFSGDLLETIMEDLNITDPNTEVDLGEIFRDQNLNVTDILDALPDEDIDELLDEVECEEVRTSEQNCACPLDFSGTACQDRRSFQCSLVIGDLTYQECMATNGRSADDDDRGGRSGRRGSDGYRYQEDGFPACWEFSLDAATIDIPMHVTCGFVDGFPAARCNGSLIDQDFIDDQAVIQNITVSELPGEAPYYNFECVELHFVYAVGGREFPLALTNLPSPPVAIDFRPWNFYRLSDSSLRQTYTLTPTDLATGTMFTNVLPVPSITPEHLPGGRMFIEVSIAGSLSSNHWSPLLAETVPSHLVLDQSDYNEPKRSIVPVGLIVGLMFGLVLPILALTAFLVWRWYKRREEESDAVMTGGAYSQMQT